MNRQPSPTMDEKSAVTYEQVRLLYSSIYLSLAVTLLNGILLISVQWNEVKHNLLLSWLTALILVTLWRGYIAFRYHHTSPAEKEHPRWNQLFNIGVGSSALTWGISGIVIFPQDTALQAFHAFVIAGMCAGAVSTLSYQRLPILVFLYLCLLPIIFQLFAIGGQIGISMGVMGVAFLAILTTSALRIHQNTLTNITLRLEATIREKALRESEERIHMIFESAPLGILHYDKEGVVEASNDAILSMLMIDNDTLIGMPLMAMVDDELKVCIQHSLEGQDAHYRGSIAAIYPKSNTEVRIHMRGIISLDGNIVGGVMVVEDISNEKHLERIKDDFIATVSHELRTPLTAIIGSLGILRSGVLEHSPEKSKPLLDNAHRNSERLLMLINDILDVEKIEAGKMDFQMRKQPLCKLLEQSVESSLGYGRQYNVEFTLLNCNDVTVCVDGHRMMQVMSNLLSNAAKFSAKGGRVEVSTEKHGDRVRVNVRDYGEGIPEEFRDKIFEKFSQAEGSAIRKVGGTGLGLNIVRQIVEHHHGAVDFHSIPGEGTTFYFDLPIADF